MKENDTLFLVAALDHQRNSCYVSENGPDLALTWDQAKILWHKTKLDADVTKTHVADHHSPNVVEMQCAFFFPNGYGEQARQTFGWLQHYNYRPVWHFTPEFDSAIMLLPNQVEGARQAIRNR
jgi:hypothetical protein